MKTRPRARATRRGSEGFTLLEVMIAVAILSVSMTGLYTAQMANMNATAYARDITAVSFLAEYIIVDLERRMAKDGGWVAQDKTYDGDFGEEGWPKIKYSCLIDFVEMPEYSQLREAKEDADTDGGGTQYQDAGDQMFSALGVVWPMVKNAIEQSIRKVSCTIVWPRGGDTEETLLIETYWTEPANLTKLPDLGGEFTEDGEDGGGGQ
ncbi:MAG: prepilin-type N-terminal cleavage/methylation domain-containing protein, partial [Myxococcales bacterium]|nr:prepilin-type N-terminal cleavage/methylation domain-containing protein [Myxococcales bacterium]